MGELYDMYCATVSVFEIKSVIILFILGVPEYVIYPELRVFII